MSDDVLRLSKSGHSLRIGWGDEKRIVATCPGASTAQIPDPQVFQQWLEDADRLVAGWNELTAARERADKLEAELAECRKIVDEQANDAGLWFIEH